MLSWADLLSLVIVFACVSAAMGGAREGGAGIVMTLLFCGGGFLVGIITAKVSHRLAFSVLRSKKLTAGVALAAYGVVPVFFLLLAIPGTMFLAIWLARQM
jgi:hypothetical protein